MSIVLTTFILICCIIICMCVPAIISSHLIITRSNQINNAHEDRYKYKVGHPKRIKAEEIIDKEYGGSRILEDNFRDKWRGTHFIRDLNDASEIIAHLCKSTCTIPIENVLVEENKAYGGSYKIREKSIYLRTDHIELVAIIHETAHHMVAYSELLTCREMIRSMFEGGHGKTFIECEKVLIDHLLSFQEDYLLSKRDEIWVAFSSPALVNLFTHSTYNTFRKRF